MEDVCQGRCGGGGGGCRTGSVLSRASQRRPCANIRGTHTHDDRACEACDYGRTCKLSRRRGVSSRDASRYLAWASRRQPLREKMSVAEADGLSFFDAPRRDESLVVSEESESSLG